MNEVRPNHPTASGVERIVLCPGSWQLEQKAPAAIQTEDAASGDRIHALLALHEDVSATEEEKECAKTCIALRHKLINEIPAVMDQETVRAFYEQRLFLPGKQFSGKPDYVLTDFKTALVIDYKTGRNEVAKAEGNWQLLSLACLVHCAFPEVEKIFVAIIQPWASPQTSVCLYDPFNLKFALSALDEHLSKAQRPNAPRIPGEKQCQYCKAKSICPEAQAQVSALALSDVRALEPAKIGELLERCIVAEGVIESIRTRAKEILFQEETAIPGWKLEPGARRRVINDTEKAFQNLSHVLSGKEFASCCKVTLGKLEKAVQKNRQLTAKEAKAIVNEELSEVITEDQNKPSLVRA